MRVVKIYADPGSDPVVIQDVVRIRTRDGIYYVTDRQGNRYGFPTARIFMTWSARLAKGSKVLV